MRNQDIRFGVRQSNVAPLSDLWVKMRKIERPWEYNWLLHLPPRDFLFIFKSILRLGEHDLFRRWLGRKYTAAVRRSSFSAGLSTDGSALRTLHSPPLFHGTAPNSNPVPPLHGQRVKANTPEEIPVARANLLAGSRRRRVLRLFINSSELRD